MAYQINKTDGTIVATVADGQIDQLSTDITLIGKNYSGFGESLNENFVKLLENFADTIEPERPIRGQIWFDATESKLKVYSGTAFVPVSSATISNVQPATLGVGDLWFNDVDRQLYFYDGSEPILLGPIYSDVQGLSGFKIENILDTLNQTRVISLLYNNGILMGLFSKDRFQIKNALAGFGDAGTVVNPGFNKGNYQLRVVDPGTGSETIYPLKFDVTVTNSEQLGGSDASNYVRKDSPNEVEGLFRVQTDLGVIIGASGNHNLYVFNGDVYMANSADNKGMRFSVRKDNAQEEPIRIDSVSRTIDLYPGFTDSNTIVGGNLTVTGNFTVEGEVTTVNTATLTVEDKTIELAKQSDVVSTDDNATGGGIILSGTTDHILVWSLDNEVATAERMALASGAWNSSEHFNLAQNKDFMIDGVPVIEQIGTSPKRFRISDNVTEFAGVSEFGKQIRVRVGPGEITDPSYITIENNEISTTEAGAANLRLNPLGDVQLVGSPRIVGLDDPIDPQDAATKEYVDNVVETRPLVFSMDLSDGKPNSYISNFILTAIAPPANYRTGTIARILCTLINNSTASFDINPLVSETKDDFNSPTGVKPALTNIAFTTATVPAPSVSTTRIVKEFQLLGGVWTFVSDTILPP